MEDMIKELETEETTRSVKEPRKQVIITEHDRYSAEEKDNTNILGTQKGDATMALELKEHETKPQYEATSKPYEHIHAQQYVERFMDSEANAKEDEPMDLDSDLDEELFRSSRDKGDNLHDDKELTKNITERPDTEHNSLRSHPLLPRPMPVLSDNLPEPRWNRHGPVYMGNVMWWDNLSGKGQIVEQRTSIVRSIAWQDLVYHRYGSLVIGAYVQFQLSRHEEFRNFWVVQGMGCITLDDALSDVLEYPYLKEVLEHSRRY